MLQQQIQTIEHDSADKDIAAKQQETRHPRFVKRDDLSNHAYGQDDCQFEHDHSKDVPISKEEIGDRIDGDSAPGEELGGL